MRLLVFLAGFVLSVECRRWHHYDSATREDFDAWKVRWGKIYKTEEAETKAFSNYRSNRMLIKEHEAGKDFADPRLPTFRMGENKFMDQDQDGMKRFKGYKNATIVPDSHHSWEKGAVFMPPLSHGALPESVDWRQHGLVTHVKDQGQCGSCWAFSSTGSLEGQMARKTGKLVSLSEQNLLDCVVGDCPDGGQMYWSFDYVKRMGGLNTEAAYPYNSEHPAAQQCRFTSANDSADSAGFARIERGNETALAWAVATVGPIAVAIDAGDSFQSYQSGIYYNPSCGNTPSDLDHGVLVVGYGKNSEGHEYWIVKNSWAATWGDEGYIKMAKNHDNMCGIATSAIYPLV